MTNPSLSIRAASRDDAALIIELIKGLADYERAPNAVVATPADIIRDGFSGEPRFHCIIAEWNGMPAGFAFYFFHYSTWLGRSGLTSKTYSYVQSSVAKASAKRC